MACLEVPAFPQALAAGMGDTVILASDDQPELPMSHFFRSILIAAALALVLAGCGNKGALVLPAKPAATPHKAERQRRRNKSPRRRPRHRQTAAHRRRIETTHGRTSVVAAMNLRFTKMHGAGNDFVIVDCRAQPLALNAAQIARLGDRHFGVGFDQLLTIEPARDAILCVRLRHLQQRRLAGRSNAATACAASPRGCTARARSASGATRL